MKKTFKINASSGGKIMGKQGIGKTGESLLNQKMVEQIFDRKKEFSNRYTQKGDLVENGSIDFVAKVLGLGTLTKNEKHYNNEFMMGTPDVITKDFIIDVKNSWDCFSFPFFNKEVPNKDYYWQAQIYMDLVGIDKYKLIYVLSDTPNFLIERESFYWCRDNGVEDLEGQVLKQFVERMTYGEIPDEKRLKVFEIERNDEDIILIKERVKKCREYISKLDV